MSVMRREAMATVREHFRRIGLAGPTVAQAEQVVEALHGAGMLRWPDDTSGTPEERIAAVLHSIGFGAERRELARRMLKLAQDFGGQ